MKISLFQQRVYRALKMIPAGRVTTYKLLASFIGCGSPRAVGQALRHNPFAPEVPCHRVIKSDLALGGYCGTLVGEKVAEKIMLLAAEGVLFKEGRLQEPRLLFEFKK